jgi:hypothetical protein
MNETAQLAGFLAAHAISCVSQGKSLTTPLLVVESEGDGMRFVQVQGRS